MEAVADWGQALVAGPDRLGQTTAVDVDETKFLAAWCREPTPVGDRDLRHHRTRGHRRDRGPSSLGPLTVIVASSAACSRPGTLSATPTDQSKASTQIKKINTSPSEFRSFTNYRLRILLAAGRCDWNLLGTPSRLKREAPMPTVVTACHQRRRGGNPSGPRPMRGASGPLVPPIYRSIPWPTGFWVTNV